MEERACVQEGGEEVKRDPKELRELTTEQLSRVAAEIRDFCDKRGVALQGGDKGGVFVVSRRPGERWPHGFLL